MDRQKMPKLETVHIHQRLRPSRCAFIIEPTDLEAALEAVSLNAALWGGIFNPLVPLEPSSSRESLLRSFDPDILVDLTKCGIPDLAAKSRGEIVPRDKLIQANYHTGERNLVLAFNILPLLRHVRAHELRIPGASSLAAIPEPAADPGWAEFTAFAYGSFRWLPPLDHSFDTLYLKYLKAQSVAVSLLSLPPGHESLTFPLSFTRYGLRTFGVSSLRLSSHIIFIGDHLKLEDLIAFWNLRASGRKVLFVPEAGFEAFEPAIRIVATEGNYPINRNVQNHADLQKGPSLDPLRFSQIGDWVCGLGLGKLSRRSWLPGYGSAVSECLDVAEIEACEGEEISAHQDGQMMPVKVIPPPFEIEDQATKGALTWSIDITTIGGYRDPDWMFSFPREPAVEAVVRRCSNLSVSGPLRVGRSGIVLQRDSLRSTLYFSPVPTREVLHALFHQAGIEVEVSNPGQYAEQIVKKMGSLEGDCRVFKVRGVRDVLERLGTGSILTKGNIYEIVMKAADANGKNWRPELYGDLVLRYGQPRGGDLFGTIFDILLEKRILRPGFEFKCPNCFKQDWYHVSEFAEQYTCRFCFTTQRVDFASKRDWQYRSDGLFQIADGAQGSIGVIISLWRFEHFSSMNTGRFITSRNLLVKKTGSRCEIDYAYLLLGNLDTDYELVLGQVARFGDFKDPDMKNMADLSDRMPTKPYLAFSTLREQFTDADKDRLRGLIGAGYRVIALTREELDPYDLFERFNDAPHRYPVNLAELSENTIHLNLGPSPGAGPQARIQLPEHR